MISTRKKIVLLLAISFLVIGVFGVGMGVKASDGKVTFCPFKTTNVTVCTTTLMEHITKWQNAFAGIVSVVNVLAFITLIATAATVFYSKLFYKLQGFATHNIRPFLSYKTEPTKVFDPMLIAFSRGIIHPKIYDIK